MSRRTLLIFGLALLGAGFWWGHSLVPSHVANSPPRQGPIIAFGDSLTVGFGAPQDSSYPAQLSRLLGRPILNKGVNGETAADALKRLERDVLSQKPGVVLVCLGGNDLLQKKNADATFQSLDTIIAKISEQGAMVVLIGVEGMMFVTEDFGSRYKKLAKKYHCAYVPDILDGIFSHSDLMSDNVHPNAKGYGMMAQRVAKTLKRQLK